MSDFDPCGCPACKAARQAAPRGALFGVDRPDYRLGAVSVEARPLTLEALLRVFERRPHADPPHHPLPRETQP